MCFLTIHNITMFFSAEAILLLYILSLTFWFTICFSFDLNDFCWVPRPLDGYSLASLPWLLGVGRQGLQSLFRGWNPFQESDPHVVVPPFSDGLMDDNLHFHHNNLKAPGPLTGMELRTPAQDSFFPKMRQLFTASPPPLRRWRWETLSLDNKMKGPMPVWEEGSAAFCQMIRNRRRAWFTEQVTG